MGQLDNCPTKLHRFLDKNYTTFVKKQTQKRPDYPRAFGFSSMRGM
jgi:hypothetical protein